MSGLPIGTHIEPCPICGERVGYYNDHDGMLGCAGHCGYGLVYDDEQSLAIHNRLSRIVRSAEEWAGLFMSGVSEEYVPACRALMDAVEGEAEA